MRIRRHSVGFSGGTSSRRTTSPTARSGSASSSTWSATVVGAGPATWSTSAVDPGRCRRDSRPPCPGCTSSAWTPTLAARARRANTGPRVRLVEADLGDPSWPDRTGLAGRGTRPCRRPRCTGSTPTRLAASTARWPSDCVPAACSSTPTTWHPAGPLWTPSRTACGTPAPPGRHRTCTRTGRSGGPALGEDADLAPLLDGRPAAPIDHTENELTVGEHAELFRRRVREAAPVWQFGDDHVMVAVR